MARGSVVAVVVAGLFLASVALGVAADGVLTFSDEVSSGDSAVAYNPNQQGSSPSPPSATVPPASPPPTSPAPPPATPPSPPATPPSPPATPPSPPATPPSPPATPPSPPTSPASSPSSGSCPANYSENFYNTFQIHTDAKHVIVGADGDSAECVLDQSNAASFGSDAEFYTGRFSINLKLPCGNSSGTVFAFYTSSDGSKPDHDECDIEILGNTTDTTYTMQTNYFVNGQGDREMRHILEWFEPCQDYHEYFIQWNNKLTIIGVDDVVLRVIYNLESKNIPYFNKGQTMSVSYWDGSSWATQGGKYQTDFEENGPFKAYINSFHDLQACAVPSERDVTPCQNPATPFCWDTPSQLSSEQEASMQSHQKYCSYNYCTDYQRWKDTEIPPECQYQDQ